MFFYRIDTVVKNSEFLPQSRDRDASIMFSGMLAEKSESLFQKKQHESYIFGVSAKGDKLTLCAILKNQDNVDNIIRAYENTLKLSFENVDIEEITFKAMFSLLTTADRANFVNDDDEVLSYFDLQPLGRRCNINYGESLIDNSITKEKLLSEASRLLSQESLSPEIERIYTGKTMKSIKGHPVHYMVRCDNSETRKLIYRTLLNALYDKGRIGSRRYAFTDWGIEDGRPNESCEAMYKSCENGAVVIRYTSGDDDNNGRHARPGGDVIAGISEIALKYRNSVLTILCLPTDCVKIKESFLENLDNVSFVELTEDTVSNEIAKNYLKSLAKESHIRADKLLYRDVDSTDRVFTASELKKCFGRWYDNKLRTSVFPQYKEAVTAKAEIKKSQPKGNAIDELNKMIGLSEAKSVINKALNFYKMQKLYKSNGISMERPAMHMIFTGNPGTAKTTVARLFAQIMKDNGLLSKGDLYEVGRADLVGKYVGWTAQIVKEKFKAARGSVLFIDEAYSLVDDKDGLFGDEAISTIVQEMENNRDNMVVIFAGYPNKMEQFLQKNPGLRSRIAFHVPFDDYNADELCDIATLIAETNGLHISDAAVPKLHGIFSSACKSADFGNGRFVRNLIESAKMEQANRILSLDLDEVTNDDIRCLTERDFIVPKPLHTNERKIIGF